MKNRRFFKNKMDYMKWVDKLPEGERRTKLIDQLYNDMLRQKRKKELQAAAIRNRRNRNAT